MTQTKTELCYLTIHEAGPLLKSKQLSPLELTRAFLDRIEQLDSKLQAYITVLPEGALAEAQAAEAAILRGEYRGPLHGIPIALKDLYDTKGIRTTAGSRVMADRVPEEDATVVTRLRSAGAVLLGKLATHEFALSMPDLGSGFPRARNPWNLEHVTGGSSSGSGAAVAAGLCMGALGTDTGGSVRQPASHCGIVGLKPTNGRVSRHGVVPLSWTLDCCGPMTWMVEDAALMLQSIAGYDPKDHTSSQEPVPDYAAALREDIRGLRIGVPRHFYFKDDPMVSQETLAAVEGALKAFEELGAQVEEVTIPSLHYHHIMSSAILRSEAFTYHQHNLRTRPQDFGVRLRSQFRMGGLMSAADYVQAQRARRVLKREFAEALQRVDLIAAPTFPIPAPTFEESEATGADRLPSFRAPFNLTGMPAISVPCGFTQAGLPVGLQIAGKPFDEATVLRAAHTYQQHAGWSQKRPVV